MRMLIAIAVLVLSVVRPSAQLLELKPAAPLNLRLINATVAESFSAIERVSGITIRVAGDVPAAVMSRSGVQLTFRDASVIAAIDAIADAANLAVVVANENTVVVQPKAR